MERFKLLPKSKIDNLPKTAGVYAFKNADDLIYIGKAINIKDRVKNHFQQPSYRDNLFMDKVDKIEYLETNSEIEALILEANLIKRYQPKYNVVWRDDKNYFYVAIAQNENGVPYVFITHQPKSSGSPSSATFIGPFVEGTALKKTLRFLRRALPYYTSAKPSAVARGYSLRARHPKLKCTYCHLGLCPGPNPDLREYKKNIKKLILILQGKRNTVLNALKREMKQLSKESKFEEAGKIRDRIYNLQQVMSHTHVIESKDFVKSDLTKSLRELLWPSLRGATATKQSIQRIECYDVSNIQGKFATGSMVSAQGGPASGWVFDKSQYKKFKIQTEDKPNDIAMLKEIIERRLSHKEWQYPEIMLIDGGKAQLNAAIKVKTETLKSLRYKTPSHIIMQGLKNIKVVSIAKGRKELFIENKKDPIPLKNLPREVYNLIKQLDDEAHRFAIAYHKKLRKKSLLK